MILPLSYQIIIALTLHFCLGLAAKTMATASKNINYHQIVENNSIPNEEKEVKLNKIELKTLQCISIRSNSMRLSTIQSNTIQYNVIKYDYLVTFHIVCELLHSAPIISDDQMLLSSSNEIENN
jgi:hypothetical protein